MYSATFGRLCKSVAKSNPWTGMQSQNVLLWVGLFEVPSRVGMLRAPSERNAKQPKSRRNAKPPNHGTSLVVLRSVASCVALRSVFRHLHLATAQRASRLRRQRVCFHFVCGLQDAFLELVLGELGCSAFRIDGARQPNSRRNAKPPNSQQQGIHARMHANV